MSCRFSFKTVFREEGCLSPCCSYIQQCLMETSISMERKGHRHAELMLQYAQDAQETCCPWERWEMKMRETSDYRGNWTECNMNPIWSTVFEYRRKQKTMTIAREEIPIPLSELPKSGKVYLSGSSYLSEIYVERYYNFGEIDRQTVDRMLKAGFVHSTKEAALAHANALIKVTKDAIEAATAANCSPCKGKNCKSIDGRNHSPECQEEYEATIDKFMETNRE